MPPARRSLFAAALLLALVIVSGCEGNPRENYFSRLGSFEKKVAAILEEVHTVDTARDAAQELESMMGRAQELGEQWQEMQAPQYQGDDPNRKREDTMQAFADGIKHNVAVENQCSRLKKETALWQHLGPVLRSLSKALDPQGGRWVAVRATDGS